MEETGNEEIDDLITQAQDALFENNLDDVIKFSKAALAISPKENEAHELIIFALTQKQSTSRDATYFSKIIESCREWNKNCGDKAKQLIAMIKVCNNLLFKEKAAYASNNLEALSEAAIKLSKMRNEDLLLEKALAAALLADVGLHNEVSHIVSKLDGDDVQDDPALAVRFEALLAWIGVCQSDIREQALEQLRELIATSEGNLSGIGFVHSLLILDAIEQKKLDEAEKLLLEAEKIGLGDEENMQGVKSILLFSKSQQVSNESIKLAEKAVLGGNALIIKRIYKHILK